MEIGQIRKVDIDQEMQQSYLDYAMSVIVARALPDARDGLKPVQRRILYAMYDMNLRADSAYKKSARIVGEVLGKYHPHGDMAVYEAMARQAQDFTMRYPSVDGQGNFGSVDGDPPAAMRYTEARLTPFSMEMLNQLDRNTVDFTPNFDQSLSEPIVLPAALPNLLVNGASGIAVGMATNIPPHNLGEVVDALLFMLDRWERLDDVSVNDLMKFIKGPDFPTGGLILQEDEEESLKLAYATGKGRVLVRGRINIEELGRGRDRLIITELPYLTNKSSLIERIAELTRDGVLEGLADLRDESDRQGMRIVIELKQGADTDKVLKVLYQKTPLQNTFGIMLLALVENEPRMLTLKQALRVYLEHRIQVVRRRCEFDLAKAKQRVHILEGLRVALKYLDEIIKLIRASSDADTAKTKLMKKFHLSELQAQAILDMPLKRLAALERKKIEDEYRELILIIKELEALLRSQKKLRGEVGNELLEIKNRFSDRRRTQIVTLKKGEVPHDRLTANSLTPGNYCWVGITQDGLVGRTTGEDLPRFSGRQAPRWIIKTNSRFTLFITASNGKTAAIATHTIPEVEHFSDGIPIQKIAAFSADDLLVAIFSTPPQSEIKDERYVCVLTSEGLIKKSEIKELPGPSAQLFHIAKVNAGDRIINVFCTSGKDDLIVLTQKGMAIRFEEDDVRPMGLFAAGVNAIKLSGNDKVAFGSKIIVGEDLVVITSTGFGWRFKEGEFPKQGRYGAGVSLTHNLMGIIQGCMIGGRGTTGIVHFSVMAAKVLKIEELMPTRRMRVASEIFELKGGDAVEQLSQLIDDLSLWGNISSQSAKAPKKIDQTITAKKNSKSIGKKKAPRRKSEKTLNQKKAINQKKRLREATQLSLVPEEIEPSQHNKPVGPKKRTRRVVKTKNARIIM